MEIKELKRKIIKGIVFEYGGNIRDYLPLILKEDGYKSYYADSFIRFKEFILNLDSHIDTLIESTKEATKNTAELIPENMRNPVNKRNAEIGTLIMTSEELLYLLGSINLVIAVYKDNIENNRSYSSNYTDYCEYHNNNVTLSKCVEEHFPAEYYVSKEILDKRVDEIADLVFTKEDLLDNKFREMAIKLMDKVYSECNPGETENETGRILLDRIMKSPVTNTRLNSFNNKNVVHLALNGSRAILEEIFPEYSLKIRNKPEAIKYREVFTEITNELSVSFDFIKELLLNFADVNNSKNISNGKFVFDKEKLESDENAMIDLFEFGYMTINNELIKRGLEPVAYPPMENPVGIQDEDIISITRSVCVILIKSILDYVADSSASKNEELMTEGMEAQQALQRVLETVQEVVDEVKSENEGKVAKKTKLFNN
nr:MAG TPA: hypothetical protein [Caudoviricetes sp.]